MWTVIYTAHDKDIAEEIQQALLREGILVKMNKRTTKKNASTEFIELLVPESEVEEAHLVILEKGSLGGIPE